MLSKLVMIAILSILLALTYKAWKQGNPSVVDTGAAACVSSFVFDA